MKTKHFTLLLFALLSLITNSFGQSNKYDPYSKSSFEFHFRHSRRIPNAKVDINIERTNEKVVFHLKSKTLVDSPEWDKYNRDTTFIIPLEKYKEIIYTFAKLKTDDIFINIYEKGFDGTSCELKYICDKNYIGFRISNIKDSTEMRHLLDFLKCCNLVLETANLNPEEIY